MRPAHSMRGAPRCGGMASSSPSRDAWRRGRSPPPGPSRPRSSPRRRDGPPPDWPAAPPLFAIERVALHMRNRTTRVAQIQSRSVSDLDRLTVFMRHSSSCSHHLLRIDPSSSWPATASASGESGIMLARGDGQGCSPAAGTGGPRRRRPQPDPEIAGTVRGGCRSRAPPRPRRQRHHVRCRNRAPPRPRRERHHVQCRNRVSPRPRDA
jgi:hypothetical protein